MQNKHLFWRDERMPYVELRKIDGGQGVGYAPHSHAQWSLGAITSGTSQFCYRQDTYCVSEGDLVLMNPHWVHACNPQGRDAWGYIMLYVETQWLAKLRYNAGLQSTQQWFDVAVPTISTSHWYREFCSVASCLMSSETPILVKQSRIVGFLSELFSERLTATVSQEKVIPARFQRVVDYLLEHLKDDISLTDLCCYSGYSQGYLIRAFKQYFGLTPHAFYVNARVQKGQQALKAGIPIVETALELGFADQSHFQRTFKKCLAATPKQYQKSLLNQQVDTTEYQ